MWPWAEMEISGSHRKDKIRRKKQQPVLGVCIWNKVGVGRKQGGEKSQMPPGLVKVTREERHDNRKKKMRRRNQWENVRGKFIFLVVSLAFNG